MGAKLWVVLWFLFGFAAAVFVGSACGELDTWTVGAAASCDAGRAESEGSEEASGEAFCEDDQRPEPSDPEEPFP